MAVTRTESTERRTLGRVSRLRERERVIEETYGSVARVGGIVGVGPSRCWRFAASASTFASVFACAAQPKAMMAVIKERRCIVWLRAPQGWMVDGWVKDSSVSKGTGGNG